MSKRSLFNIIGIIIVSIFAGVILFQEVVAVDRPDLIIENAQHKSLLVMATSSDYITVTYPTNGEIWEIGKTYNVTWNHRSEVDKVNLVLRGYKNPNETDETASGYLHGNMAYHYAVTASSTSGSYSYTVPEHLEDNLTDYPYFRVKATYEKPIPGSTQVNWINYYSDGNFSIVASSTPSATCTDSDGGINYYEKGMTSGNHQDSCFKDKNWAAGVNYDVNGLYEKYCDGQTRVVEYSCPYGCSDGACLENTTTATTSIEILSPNGGENWQISETYNITWTAVGSDGVIIDLLDYTSQMVSIKRVANYVASVLGKYSWTIPSSVSPGEKYHIRARDAGGSLTFEDESDDYFSIIESVENDYVIEQDINPYVYQNTIFAENINSNQYMANYKKGQNQFTNWATVYVFENHEDAKSDLSILLNALPATNGTYAKVSYKNSTLYAVTSKGSGTYSYIWLSNNFMISIGGQLVEKEIPTELLDAYLQKYPQGVTALCTDSDGGKDYYTKGYVTSGGKTYYDECSGSKLQVNEKYCYISGTGEKVVGTSVYTCPNGCSEEACIKKTTETEAPVITSISPNQGKQGETVETYIYGSNFTGADEYSGSGLSPVSDRGFQLVSSGVVSDNKIKATYEIASDAEVGRRLIKVQTPYGISNYVKFYVNAVSDEIPIGCLPDGTLIKLPTDSKIYVIIDCQKKWIQGIDEFNKGGYKWEDVEEMDSPVIQAYADYLEAKADLLRAIGHNRVYRIKNGKLLWIPTISAFNAQGFKWEDVENASESEINQYPEAKLLRKIGDVKVYYITNGGLKRHILSSDTFNSYGNKWEDIIEVTEIELDAYDNNDLVRVEGDEKIYKLENGKKRWIKTANAFNKYGYNWNKVAPVNQTEINEYPEESIIE